MGQGETPLAFLNKIQKVPYTLNSFTVEVAKALQEKGVAVGKFLPIVHYDLPPKPVDIADNKDSRLAYRRAAAEVMNMRAAENGGLHWRKHQEILKTPRPLATKASNNSITRGR